MFKLGPMSEASADLGGDYDVIIVGGGPAGYAAAIYTARDGWKTLILERGAGGGLAATTHMIENYPGFPDGIDGEELMHKFLEQAKRFGAAFSSYNGVREIIPPVGGVDERYYTVNTVSGKSYRGKTILIATGSSPKQLGIPGEKEYLNRGVAYCATCDGPLYKGKRVMIVGCGNSGLQESEVLLNTAESVTFVEFLPRSPAERIHFERVRTNPKAHCLLNHAVVEIKGEQVVQSVVLRERENGEQSEIPMDAVFIYAGYRPATEFLQGFVDLDERGSVISNPEMQASRPGVFVAGDVRSGNPAQAAIAVGDGARAALAIRHYLQKSR